MYVLGCPTVLHFNTAVERWRRLLIAQRLNNSSSLHPPYLQLSSSQIPPITCPSSTNLIYTHTPPTLHSSACALTVTASLHIAQSPSHFNAKIASSRLLLQANRARSSQMSGV